MLSLNIFMQTLELSPSIVQENDTIRVSVTTLPGEQKQAFTFEAKKIESTRPFFSVKIDKKTDKLIIVLRKKSFSEKDPIIASTVIKRDQLPTKFNDNTNTEMKTIKLLEPVQQNCKKNVHKGSTRKSVGQIELQFSLTQEFSCSKNTMKIQKNKKNCQGYSKIDTLLENENEYDNFLFNGPITN